MKKRISAFALALVLALALLPAAALAAGSDFVIEEGVLVGYTGTDSSAVIPDGVTGIAGLAFLGCEDLKRVTIPASVTWMGDGVFFGSGVTDIYYEGSKAQWDNISIVSMEDGEFGNPQLLRINIHYNSPMPTAEPVAESTAQPIVIPFEDVYEKDWFYDNVAACYEEGIMLGTEPTLFSPYGILREEETATLAARLLARQRGETVPAQEPGETWYAPVLRYLEDLHLDITPGIQCTRGRFLVMLEAVLEEDALEPSCEVDRLPDTSDPNVLKFYRAGILNGKDPYGTFQAYGTLNRAEAAAMVSRVLRTELRSTVVLADYSPFRAAGVTPSTLFFTNGVTAERYLTKVNELIAFLEDLCVHNGTEFNWHEWYSTYAEISFLDYVTETALSDLGVTESMGSQAYGQFLAAGGVPVYYTRLIDQRGGVPLGSAG